MLPDLELRIARFLGVPISSVRNPDTNLAPPLNAGAQLRRVRDLDRDRLAPAIHSALQIGAAVVRNLKPDVSPPAILPEDGIEWRNEIERSHPAVGLDDLLRDLWGRGIPVVAIEQLPAPSFQGIACIIDDRPVIMLGHKHDEPGRVAFLVAHEAGHISAGDCAQDQPVVDEEEEIADDSDMERRADRYATRVVVGADHVPQIDGTNFRELATRAAEIEESSGADASAVIFAWASGSGDYASATMAVKALYRGSGARHLIRQHFERYVDLDGAAESYRGLLGCVAGGSDRDDTAH
jgi:Zn-dependent peptidase ImmA (M78 family)